MTDIQAKQFCILLLISIRKALQRFHEILKPGGTLGFTVVGQSRIFQALVDIGTREKWRDIMKVSEKKRLKAY